MSDKTTHLQARVKVLEDALRRLLEPFGTDPCSLDHHGYCQEHYIQADCCVAYARSVLAASQPADPVTNAVCCQQVKVTPQEPASVTLDAALQVPEVRALVEAIEDAFACGMIQKSSAADGGANKYSEQVRVADNLRAALHAIKETAK